MNSLSKTGAVAAFSEAAIYLFGFGVLIFLTPTEGTDMSDASERLAFILSQKTLYQYWILTIYVLFGVLLAFLVTALHEPKATFATIGTVLGYVWVVLVIASGMLTSVGLETVAKLFETQAGQAVSLWLSIETIQNGLGGGVEVVGGLWVFMFSLQALQLKKSFKAAHVVGLLVGALGILTVLPPLGDLAAAFGLGQILWFVLIGLFLWKQAGVAKQ